MTEVQRTYIPAAGHHLPLPLYDPLVKLLGGDGARRVLIGQADLRPTDQVLEVGCGTGTLLMLIKQRHPNVEVTGLDPDAGALARARRKAQAASVALRLDQGFADRLQYPNGFFDRVFSCFMLHHLKGMDEKRGTLREVRRVLKPDGTLHLLDFRRPTSGEAGVLGQWLHASELLRDNTETRVLSLMQEAGFAHCEVMTRARMLFAFRTAYYRATA